MSLRSSRPPEPNVTTIYSRLAPVYDAWTWFTERHSLQAALSRSALRDGEAVLEVAVGTGFVFRELLRRNPSGRNVGIDLTPAMLQRARQKAEQSGVPFELSVADARALPFPDATFDLVINNNMFGLVARDDFAPILAEILRVLRPGARLVVVTMTRPPAGLGHWVYRIGAQWLGGWRDVDMDEHVRAAGFERLERQVVTQLGIPSEILLARKPGGH